MCSARHAHISINHHQSSSTIIIIAITNQHHHHHQQQHHHHQSASSSPPTTHTHVCWRSARAWAALRLGSGGAQRLSGRGGGAAAAAAAAAAAVGTTAEADAEADTAAGTLAHLHTAACSGKRAPGNQCRAGTQKAGGELWLLLRTHESGCALETRFSCANSGVSSGKTDNMLGVASARQRRRAWAGWRRTAAVAAAAAAAAATLTSARARRSSSSRAGTVAAPPETCGARHPSTPRTSRRERAVRQRPRYSRGPGTVRDASGGRSVEQRTDQRTAAAPSDAPARPARQGRAGVSLQGRCAAALLYGGSCLWGSASARSTACRQRAVLRAAGRRWLARWRAAARPQRGCLLLDS
jgi:hypothetical protein